MVVFQNEVIDIGSEPQKLFGAGSCLCGGKTFYFSGFFKTGREILVVNKNGIQRTAVVGHVKIETRPLIIVEAKELNNQRPHTPTRGRPQTDHDRSSLAYI